MSLKNTAVEVIQSPKTAAAVGGSTAAMGNFLSWLPDAVLAKVATLLGICLTLLLIAVQVYKLKAEMKKRRLLDLQIKDLERKPREYDDVV
jgi:hypothetical protein